MAYATKPNKHIKLHHILPKPDITNKPLQSFIKWYLFTLFLKLKVMEFQLKLILQSKELVGFPANYGIEDEVNNVCE